MSKSVVIIGSGGHAASVMDVVEQIPEYSIKGLIDKTERIGSVIAGYEVRWGFNDIRELVANNYLFVFGEGWIKDSHFRVETYFKIIAQGGQLPVVVSPAAYVSRFASIGDGTVVFHGCIVNARARVGRNCILNTGCILEHDVDVGDHCHVSTRATLNGGVSIGEQTFIGSGAVAIQNVTIASQCLIGANSLVTKDASEVGTYVGSPARKIR